MFKVFVTLSMVFFSLVLTLSSASFILFTIGLKQHVLGTQKKAVAVTVTVLAAVVTSNREDN